MLHSEPPKVFLAESDATLSRLLALRLVAEIPAGSFTDDDLEGIRAALLDEDWARAVQLWLMATDEELDVWDSEELVWDAALDDEHAAMEVRLAPIFEESDSPGAGA